jgi:hypothetical protein
MLVPNDYTQLQSRVPGWSASYVSLRRHKLAAMQTAYEGARLSLPSSGMRHNGESRGDARFPALISAHAVQIL